MRISNYNAFLSSNYESFLGTSSPFLSQANQSQTQSQANFNKTQIKSETSVKTSKTQNSSALYKQLSQATLKRLINARNNAEFNEIKAERQDLSVKMKATIYAQNRSVSVDMSLNLSHSFLSVARLKKEQFADPLVVTLDGAMPSFTDELMSFDIDADGEVDQISKLGKNTAFLALDLNKNGEIDSGRELFGAKSGDGFGELRRYDDDKNGFIDENDEIFNKLRIWRTNGDKRELLALGEVGIGAIFLGEISSEFNYKNNQNDTLARLKSSGFFLFENGKSGVISSVDFAKFKIEKELKITPILSQNSSRNLKKLGESRNLEEILKERLKALNARLKNATDPQEIMLLNMQITAINAQILGGFGG